MKLLIVVDYQNDFVEGALGFEGAEKLDEKIAQKIKEYHKNNDEVIDDNPNVNVDENQREVDSILDNQDEVINNDDNDNIDNVDNNNDSMNSDRNNDSINDSNDNNNPNNNDDNNGGGK